MQNAWLVSFIRFRMLIIALLVLFLLFSLFGLEVNYPFLSEMSTLYFNVVNAICLFLLLCILNKEGRSILELIGFRSEYIGKTFYTVSYDYLFCISLLLWQLWEPCLLCMEQIF